MNSLSHHAENVTPVSFPVLWCSDLYVVSASPFGLFTVLFAFMSHCSSGASSGQSPPGHSCASLAAIKVELKI